MIGWKPCHVYCGCLDEDACLKAPKNQANLPTNPHHGGKVWDGRPNGVRSTQTVDRMPPRAPQTATGALKRAVPVPWWMPPSEYNQWKWCNDCVKWCHKSSCTA